MKKRFLLMSQFSFNLFVLLSFASLLSGCGVEVDPRTIWKNHVGVSDFKKGSVTDSQRDFLDALKVDPFIGELHVNLGLTYQALQQGDSAVQSYQSAEKWGRNPEVIFNSRFNQGVMRGLNKQIDLALNDYQRALEVKVDSLETKTNIELLVQGQSGSGEGEGKDKQEGKEGKDQKDQDKKGEGDKDKDQEQDPSKPKQVQKNQEYKPREFKGDLSENDVKKILGELKQQEQKIRGQFYRGDSKEKPREKDW
jgi:Ca-activated chloride channel homolog